MIWPVVAIESPAGDMSGLDPDAREPRLLPDNAAVGVGLAPQRATPMQALNDSDLDRLQSLLDALPPPLEPLDLSALDGFLCGVLLQPKPVPAARWLRHVADAEGRPPPPGMAPGLLEELHALAQRRHAELEHAIAQRQWFDPWIAELEPDAPVADAVLPWVAGFATASELFPGLLDADDPELIEPLAMLYQHFDPADLEDADALLAVIDTLEPPADLAEAAEDLVRAVLLMADVTRPLPTPARARSAPSARRRAAPRR